MPDGTRRQAGFTASVPINSVIAVAIQKKPAIFRINTRYD
jgi:hypothetical protein